VDAEIARGWRSSRSASILAGMARQVLLSLLIGLVISTAACGPDADPLPSVDPSPSAQVGPPNVLLITIDTLRPDRIGVYGHATARTPRIDALAAEGVRFEQATVTVPRTTPALASLHTGRLPRAHGVREVGMKITVDDRVAIRLREQGYATLGFVASPVVAARQGFALGFDRFEVIKDAEELSQTALESARAVPSGQPLFLWVHYMDPHFYYLPPDHFEDQPEAPACRALLKRIWTWKIRLGQAYVDHRGESSAALSDCKKLYDAEIAWMDVVVGRLLDGLEAAGRRQNAHVVFASDHGEHLGERGVFYEHGPTVHDADVRIPLLWSGPGVIAGHVDGEPTTLEDILPTLLSRLGMNAGGAADLDGYDLSGRLLGERDGSRELVFAESASALQSDMVRFFATGGRRNHCIHEPPYSLCSGKKKEGLFQHVEDPDMKHDVSAAHPEVRQRLEEIGRRWPPETARERMARGARFKLVQFPQPEGGYRDALFDLGSDPGEAIDVSAEHPTEVARLRAALERWLEGLDDFDAPERDEATLEELRALGYVD
jgi:arylsulfatase A-like enzyme